jgi:hypothetical protein
MRELKRILIVVLIGAMIAVGGLAQGNDNRPPKDKPRVVDKDKEKPPPSNSNSNSNKRGKP